eukprot:c11042_g1_i1.p1 GENE.c11042_g1_i1~~c11042_g1_i1.p1  ORF type:complete len:256 (-),score=47.31 c11042_g1_i1:79-846(-)
MRSALATERIAKKKCTEKSLAWLDKSIKLCSDESLPFPAIDPATRMVAAIQGADVMRRRADCAKEMAKREVAGYAIGGLYLGESPQERFDLLEQCVVVLPPSKFRILQGCHRPIDILDAVLLGVDLFEGSYAAQLTLQGYAATFQIVAPHLPHRAKRQRLEENAPSRSIDKISLLDNAFALDERPLLPGCQCYTCTHHTRAYLHHLVVCREMTADVLLDLHNIAHMTRFMEQVRERIEDETIQDYVDWFRETVMS